MKQTLLTAFGVAFSGIGVFLKTDRNGRIHAGIAFLVVVAGFVFHISSSEWMFILISIAMVLAAEMMNYAIEKSCDLISKSHDLRIKIIKDVSAGAVLVTAIISIIIGCIIFLPKIFAL